MKSFSPGWASPARMPRDLNLISCWLVFCTLNGLQSILHKKYQQHLRHSWESSSWSVNVPVLVMYPPTGMIAGHLAYSLVGCFFTLGTFLCRSTSFSRIGSHCLSNKLIYIWLNYRIVNSYHYLWISNNKITHNSIIFDCKEFKYLKNYSEFSTNQCPSRYA